MPGPLQAAGASPEPSEYAPLTMDRYLTGMWTQRSPLRDADVPYLYGKFYSASRFDSIIDGINREVTARLTVQRRPGLGVYNANHFPAINTFYSFKYINSAIQQIRVMADTAGIVYDATAGGQINVWNKSAGSGTTRFLGIGSELFFANGVDTKKWLKGNKQWAASTDFDQGDFIIDSNGNIQSVQSTNGMATIADVEIRFAGNAAGGYEKCFLILTFTTPAPTWIDNVSVTFAGLTGFTQLNGQSLTWNEEVSQYPLALTADQAAFFYGANVYAPTPDTGTASFLQQNSGSSGATVPTWNAGIGGTTTDGTILWTCFGSAVQNWSMPAPVSAPSVNASKAAITYWDIGTEFAPMTPIIDSNGSVQIAFNSALTPPVYVSGNSAPAWNKSTGGNTSDGTIVWLNAGQIAAWVQSFAIGGGNFAAITDTNGNLQLTTSGLGAISGTVQPTWNATIGGTTTDGGITWTNVGGGTLLTTAQVQWAYSYHGIDGSVTTASPVATILYPMLGFAGAGNGYKIALSGPNTTDPQCDQIWIWRTAQGGSTLLLLDQIPNPSIGTAANWTYTDILPDSALNAQIAAPIADSNDPIPSNATAPVQHLQRVWVIIGNTVQYSGGPDTLVGNGNTAFPPLNLFQFPEQVVKLIPFTTNNGGLLVCGTANNYVILGTGTSTNPFYDTVYMPTVGFLNYDAITMVGSTLYGFTSNNKFISLDPSAGYVECGFPIGDQFSNVTTGNAFGGVATGALYDPATTYVTWNERTSGDSGIYVSDGAIGWFRYSPVASPESGYLWSPRAVIEGGTSAVLSIETTNGVQSLLVGSSTAAGGGPILFRDTTTFADNGTSYDASYFTMGNITLCESGEVAEIAHVCLDSMRIGAQPTVGLLFGEIAATEEVQFDFLDVTCPDPPDLPESQTLYSDRYVTAQNGVCPKCRHIQLMIAWPSQNVGDELLSHAIYGAKWSERRQQ